MPSPSPQPLRIGEWLVLRGVLTRRQLYRALQVGHAHDWRLGDAVVVLGFASRTLVEAEAEILALRRAGGTDFRRRQLERRIDRFARAAAVRRRH